jgi:hypothetical protein
MHLIADHFEQRPETAYGFAVGDVIALHFSMK